jgi:capsular exopolysaccharide synthesis family protein
MAELGPALQQLHILRVETVRREAELAAQFGGRHPRLLDARRDLAELDRRIVEEHRALLRELEGEAAIARRREATLARELERLESSAGDGARTDHELRALTAEVELERRVYAALLERVETAGGAPVGEVAAAALARAVAPAFPDFPDPRVVLTVSLAVSLLVAGLAVYLAELRETGLHGRGEVETELGLPCLALVPRLRHGRGRPAPHDYLVERPQSRFAEALRGVLASLVAERTHGAGRVLLIASALPAEGKTTLALALGRLAALEGLKTLLIDADFRRPMVHATLGAKPLPGFPELLRGELTLADALRQDPRTPLRLLPGNRRVGQPIRLLGEAGAKPLLARLSAEFDLVILDTAPLAAVSDARLLALAADRVLMVARWQSTPRAAVAQALAAMRDLGPGAATLAGVVLNDVDLARQAAAGWADAGVGPARLAGYYTD